MRTLTPEEAKAFYDKFGEKQDKQIFYEAPALRTLCANADLGDAQSVFEFGCGTGRFALELLQRYLPATARYRGTEISSTMADLATGRLAPFSPRASITLVPANGPLTLQPDSIDRFISTYVLDLLPGDTQRQTLDEARRALRPGGLLCLAGITPGISPTSRVVMAVWQWLFIRNPRWVGGCRPFRIKDFLPTDAWHIRYHTVVVAWGVASEIVIASPASP